tara:strand:+ start:2618 stop:2785 length:168 start_codon:yes stop_codon:yes gene_type:complete
MSQSNQAIYANSTGSRSTRSSTTSSNKASREGHAKKLALLEGYKKLLRVIKMAEK